MSDDAPNAPLITVEHLRGRSILSREDGETFVVSPVDVGGYSLYPLRDGPHAGIHLDYTIADTITQAIKHVGGFIREDDGSGTWTTVGV